MGYRRNKGGEMIKRLGGRGTRMNWKDTSRDKMEAVGCAEASITVKTELFLGLDEDVRTNWNRTSCLSRRICFSTKIQWHVGNVSCCISFAHFPFDWDLFLSWRDGTIFNRFKFINFIFLILWILKASEKKVFFFFNFNIWSVLR